MDEHEVVWPMGMSDQDPSLADRPLMFNPKGFLVAILDDDDHAERARAALQKAGFADRDLRVYTSRQILADHQRYLAQRSLARRVVGGVTDDTTALERYLGHARQGRSALWSMSPTTPTPSGPSAPWLTTRSFISATTAKTGRKTSTSAEQSQPAAAQSCADCLPSSFDPAESCAAPPHAPWVYPSVYRRRWRTATFDERSS